MRGIVTSLLDKAKIEIPTILTGMGSRFKSYYLLPLQSQQSGGIAAQDFFFVLRRDTVDCVDGLNLTGVDHRRGIVGAEQNMIRTHGFDEKFQRFAVKDAGIEIHLAQIFVYRPADDLARFVPAFVTVAPTASYPR